MNVPWTILKLLQWTTSYFQQHDIDSPRATAEILLSHCLHLERIDLYLQYDRPMSEDELAAFKRLIKRRAAREPVAYIVGEREFWSIPLKVGPEVLVPRPETECLVERALEKIPDASGLEERLHILELGTGSGAIVIALAGERPGHHYYASDISQAAAAMARRNADINGRGERIFFFVGDWFAPLKGPVRGFDVILSNPPYIPSETIDHLQAEVSDYEPRTALDGGKSGLDSLDRLICEAPRYLAPGGILFLEIGYDQRQGVSRAVDSCGGYETIQFYPDYAGYDRIAVITAAKAYNWDAYPPWT